MAISFKKYIDITSSVGGTSVVATRELIGRIFSINPLIPTSTIVTFTSLADVGTFFGTDTEEYTRAAQYFSFISKTGIVPKSISYSFWAMAATAPLIYGTSLTETLTQFQAITDGAFKITIGGVLLSLTAIDFSSAMSLTAIANILQTAVRTGTGTVFTSATVTYNSGTTSFDFVGGATGANTISVAAGASGTDISGLIGWFPEAVNGVGGAIWSDGVAIETITQTLTKSAQISNNFGSFLFTSEAALNLSEITEAATWNLAQNVAYQYCVPVTAANASAYSTALIDIGGTGVTLDPGVANEYPEQAQMQILAATDYTQRNAVQNYSFQMLNLTPSVQTDTNFDLYNSLRINFYGLTQQAGQGISFYQSGVLMGDSTSPQFMNIYANEQWLKDAIGVSLMNLFLALPEIPANSAGQILITGAIESVINGVPPQNLAGALYNGAISVGKTLTAIQRAAVTTITGDPNAWQQVQNSGYWLSVLIIPVVVNSVTQYQAQYTLVYSKDDVVSKVEGTHILI